MVSQNTTDESIDYVSDIPDDYGLVEGPHERNVILEHICEDVDDWSHGQLFVKVKNGEYTDVLFYPGNVPYLQKHVTRIK